MRMIPNYEILHGLTSLSRKEIRSKDNRAHFVGDTCKQTYWSFYLKGKLTFLLDKQKLQF